MCRVCIDVFECIGHTSSMRLGGVSSEVNFDIWGKCEFQNFTGRAYDRVVQALLDNLRKHVLQDSSMEVVLLNYVGEASSFTLIKDLRKLITTIYTTDKQGLMLQGVGGLNINASFSSVEELNRSKSLISKGFVLDIWDSDFSVEVFSQTLAEEILSEHGCVNYIAVSSYDPSILIGVAKRFRKECGPSTKIIAIDSEVNPVLYRWFHGLEKVETASPDPYLGLKYNRVPNVVASNRNLIHEVVTVNHLEATSMWRRLLEEEAIPAGYISGFTTAGLKKFIEKKHPPSGVGIAVLSDHVMNYINTRKVFQ